MTRTLFSGGMIFDGTGAAPYRADLVISGGLIDHVGTDLDGDEQVDCTGRLLLPGLFDCHVHLMVNGIDPVARRRQPFSLMFFEAIEALRATLATGITTIREAGGADLGVKRAQELGMVPGPRMQLAITMLSQTGGHGDTWEPSGSHSPLFPTHPGKPSGLVDGPDEVRRKVRELIRSGADVIKVATSGGVLSPRDDPRHAHFRDDEIAVMVEEATAAGVFVMSHAQGTDGIKAAIRGGIRSIEHGVYLDDEAIAMMLEHGTWLVPTLMAPLGVLEAAERGVQLAPEVVAKAEQVTAAHTESVRRAIAAGVRIAMGTDSGVTVHGRNLEELAHLVDAGSTPLQALHSATGSAAELTGLSDRLGTLMPGKLADLVVLNGDNLDLDHPGSLHKLAERVLAVYQDGVRVMP